MLDLRRRLVHLSLWVLRAPQALPLTCWAGLMPLQWSTHGALALTAALVAVAMGAFIYHARPDRRQNRLLAAAVALGGLSAGFYFGAPLFATDPGQARVAIWIGIALLIPLPPVYLLFLGTIRTPLTRPLRGRPAVWSLAAYTLLVEIAWFGAPHWFVDGIGYHAGVGWHLDAAAPHLGLRAFLLGGLAAVQLYGLLVALVAYRTATTTSARQQAGAFALAFGSRDLLGAAFIAYFASRTLQIEGARAAVFFLAVPGMDLLFYLLLAYGILKTQLFDIDLRLKLAFEHSLIATPFAVSFFLASETLERFVPFESFWLGLASAALIVLLLRPIRNAASRLADGLVPGVERTPEYIGARAREVYRNAIEAALEDGRVSDAERRVLQRLGLDLGLAAEDASALEAQVMLTLAPT
ncbi:MAG TPA: hypothetical protein VMN60_13430 [Longimicrobiales bacterium]|nr:hypothetical protein [Longimicrobiales bacterium]